MRKLIVSLVLFAVMVWFQCLWAADLTWKNISRENVAAQCILINTENHKTIFVGFKGYILKSTDAGENWKNVLRLSSKNQKVNQLIYDVNSFKTIYAATDNGLYRSQNLGGTWERIFKGKNNQENQCTAIASSITTLCVGTKFGVFTSQDQGRSWSKEVRVIGNQEILNIDVNLKQKNIIYLAAINGLFKSSSSGLNWEKIYSSYLCAVDNDIIDDRQDTDAEVKKSQLRFVKADNNNLNLLYFSSAQGVYRSLDQGKTWNKLTEYGLLSADVKMVCLADNSQIFALTASGVFTYLDERWRELSLGLAENNCNFLSLDQEGGIYLTGDKGVFKATLEESRVNIVRSGALQEYLKSEPSIRDVQLAAIKYAEVSPEKIALWRNKLTRKALLPQLNIGLDRNTTDLWHWEGGSTTKADDDTLRRGKDNVDWDVTLSWDLSDLIWNHVHYIPYWNGRSLTIKQGFCSTFSVHLEGCPTF